ncbi:MAG TPA: isocitrate lyase/phosphoenolpyruvate mutase family protein [Pseudolabrys sp.]|nr:isocitrate lyase/phosphoenolpyruvate mutase family protein [Pseudolabrys sp.]
MSPSNPRAKFRAILNGNTCISPASVFDPISARIAEQLGFELGMLAGSTASLAVLGAPDLLLITLTEFAEQARRICRAMALPLLVDADHGYGNALNVERTIAELESAGVAAATIEDTMLPAAFGASGKSALISIDEGRGKMRAALTARRDESFAVVGRTSAPIICGIEDTVQRLAAYEQAGVDALFIVGLKSIADLEIIAQATSLPLILGNAGGDLEGADLAAYRVRILLQGHLPIMAAAQAVYDTLKALRDGKKPAEISNSNWTQLMRGVTQAKDYDQKARLYLSPGAGGSRTP